MKETIQFDYFVFRDGELVEQMYTEIKITKKQIKEAIDFIKDHPTGEIEDLPASIYDSMLNAAFDDAHKEFSDWLEEEANYSYNLQKYIPLDLANFLPDEVLELLPDEVLESIKEENEYPAEDVEQETDEEIEEEYPEPTKENSLYLTIKQSYFDQIIAGTKKEEYRELKLTTYKKYLKVDEIGAPYIYTEKYDGELPDDYLDLLFMWNNGVCPLVPNIDLYYLDLAVGYNKNRDTATVQIKNFTFEPIINPSTGKPFFFTIDSDGHARMDDNGDMCYWQIVFHLGEVVKLDKHN